MTLSRSLRKDVRFVFLALLVLAVGTALARIRLEADVSAFPDRQICPEDTKPVVAKLTGKSLQTYNSTGSLITSQPVSVIRYRSVKLGDGSISYERRSFDTPYLEEFYGVYTTAKVVDSSDYPLVSTPFVDGEVSGTIFPLVGKTWQEKEVVNMPRLKAGDSSLSALAIKPLNSTPACYQTNGSALSVEQILTEGVEVILSDVHVEGRIIPVDYEQHAPKYDESGNKTSSGPAWPLGAGVTATLNGENLALHPFTLEPSGQYWWLGRVARPKGKAEAAITETARYSKGWGGRDFTRAPDQPPKTELELSAVKDNVTFYVTIYRPGEGGIEGGCIGQQDIRFYSRQADGTVKEGCSHQTGDTIGTKHLDKFYPGGIAVNHPASGFAAFPLPEDIKGRGTWWIQLPGYEDGPVPVVDTFAVGQSKLHESVGTGSNGEDYRYRLDLAVQNSSQEQELREKLKAAGATDASDFGAIKVPGSSVFFGYITPYGPTSKLDSGSMDSYVAIKHMDGSNLGWWSNGWRPDDSMLVSGFDTWHSREILFPSEAALQGQDIEVVVPIVDRFPSCNSASTDPEACGWLNAKSAFGVFVAPGPWHDVGSGLFNGMNRQFSPVSPAEPGNFPYYMDMLGSFVVDYAKPAEKVTVKLNFGGMPLELRRRVYMWGAIVAKINPMAVMYPTSLVDDSFNHTHNDLITFPTVAYNNPDTPPPIKLSDDASAPLPPVEPTIGDTEQVKPEVTPPVTEPILNPPSVGPAPTMSPEPVSVAVIAVEAVKSLANNTYETVKEAFTPPTSPASQISAPTPVTPEPEQIDDVGTSAIKKLSARVATLDIEVQSIRAQLSSVKSDPALSRRQKIASQRALNRKILNATRSRRTVVRNLALAQRYYRQYQTASRKLEQLKASPKTPDSNWRSRRAYNSWRISVRRQEATLRTLTRNLTRLGA